MQMLLEFAREYRNEAAEADDFEVQGMFEGFIGGFMKQLWFLRGCLPRGRHFSG